MKDADRMGKAEQRAALARQAHADQRAELLRLTTDHAAELNDAQLGAPGAATRAAAIAAEITKVEAELAKQDAAAASADAELARERRRIEQEDELDRQLRLPPKAKEVQQAADKAQALAVDLGLALNHLLATSTNLADLIGTVEAKRLMGRAGVAHRIQNGLANSLSMPMPEGGPRLSWLPYPVNPIEAKSSLSEITRSALDSLVRFYASEEEALAAQARIQPPPGQKMHVLPGRPGTGLFTLLAGKLRGAAAQFGDSSKGHGKEPTT